MVIEYLSLDEKKNFAFVFSHLRSLHYSSDFLPKIFVSKVDFIYIYSYIYWWYRLHFLKRRKKGSLLRYFCLSKKLDQMASLTSSMSSMWRRNQGEKNSFLPSCFFPSLGASGMSGVRLSASTFESPLSVIEECTVVVLGLWDSVHLLYDIQRLLRALQSHCGPVRGAHRFPVKPPPCLVRPEYPGVVLAVTFLTPEAAAAAVSASSAISRASPREGGGGEHSSPVPTSGWSAGGAEEGQMSSCWWEGLLRIAPISKFRLTQEEAEDCRKTFMPISIALESLRHLYRAGRDDADGRREGGDSSYYSSTMNRSSSYEGPHVFSNKRGNYSPNPSIAEEIFSHAPPPHTFLRDGRKWKLGEEKRHSSRFLASSSRPGVNTPYYSPSAWAEVPLSNSQALPHKGGGTTAGSHPHPGGAPVAGNATSLMAPPTTKEMELLLHSSDRWGIREKLWFVLCSPLSWYTSVVDWKEVEVAATTRGDAIVIDEESLCAVFSPDLSLPHLPCAAVPSLRAGPSSLSSFISSSPGGAAEGVSASGTTATTSSSSASPWSETWNQESDALSAMQRQYGTHPSIGRGKGRRRGNRGDGSNTSGKGFPWSLPWRAMKEGSISGNKEEGRATWGGERSWRKWASTLLGVPLSPILSSSGSPLALYFPNRGRKKQLLPSAPKQGVSRLLYWLIPGWNGVQRRKLIMAVPPSEASSPTLGSGDDSVDSSEEHKRLEIEKSASVFFDGEFAAAVPSSSLLSSSSIAKRTPLLLLPFAEPPVMASTAATSSSSSMFMVRQGDDETYEKRNKSETGWKRDNITFSQSTSTSTSLSPLSVEARFAAYEAAKKQLTFPPPCS